MLVMDIIFDEYLSDLMNNIIPSFIPGTDTMLISILKIFKCPYIYLLYIPVIIVYILN